MNERDKIARLTAGRVDLTKASPLEELKATISSIAEDIEVELGPHEMKASEIRKSLADAKDAAQVERILIRIRGTVELLPKLRKGIHSRLAKCNSRLILMMHHNPEADSTLGLNP